MAIKVDCEKLAALKAVRLLNLKLDAP